MRADKLTIKTPIDCDDACMQLPRTYSVYQEQEDSEDHMVTAGRFVVGRSQLEWLNRVQALEREVKRLQSEHAKTTEILMTRYETLESKLPALNAKVNDPKTIAALAESNEAMETSVDKVVKALTDMDRAVDHCEEAILLNHSSITTLRTEQQFIQAKFDEHKDIIEAAKANSEKTKQVMSKLATIPELFETVDI